MPKPWRKALKEQGKLIEALEAYNTALAIKPDYAEAYNNMGVSFMNKGDLDKAIESYRQALIIDLSLASAYQNIINIIRLKEDFGEKARNKIIEFIRLRLNDIPFGEALKKVAELASISNDDCLKSAIMRKASANDEIFSPTDRKVLTGPRLNKGWAPKVSIFCLAHNHQETIGKTLSSFFSQDFNQPFEIIISDDASTDGTFEVVADWKKRFPEYIKIIKYNQNVYSMGRQAGEVFFDLAKGEFIAACEGDDYWLDPGKLRMQVEALEEHPKMISSTHAYIDYDILTKQAFTADFIDDSSSFIFEDQADVRSVKRIFMAPTLVYRNCISRRNLLGELFSCKAGDQVLTSFLGNFGGNIHMPKLIGSVYNRGPFGVWSPLSPSRKDLERFRAHYAIFRMNCRMQNREVMDQFRGVLSRNKLPIEQKVEVMKQFDNRFKIAQHYWKSDMKFEIL